MHTDEALDIGRAVLHTLAGIHARDWLHRDIAPDNIYLIRESEVATDRPQTSVRLRDRTSVHVLLLDFGAARQALGGRTQRLDVILKPGYAPFEQYQERVKLGPATDLYAFAATLFELLTGSPPPPAVERIASPDRSTLVWPPDIRRIVSPHVQLAIERGLQLLAKNRPQSAEAFERELFQMAGPAIRKDSTPVRTRPGDYVVGRASDCHVVIPDDTVSSQHALLTVMMSGALRLCDQNSTNGTFVIRSGAAERVGRLGVPIAVDDIVRFGEVDVLVADLLATLPKLSEQKPLEKPERDDRHRGKRDVGDLNVALSRFGDRELRIGAGLIDMVLAGLLVLISRAAGVVAPEAATAVVSLGLLALGTTQLVMLTQSGQTIGKRLMGLRIVDATSGQHAGFIRIVLLRTMLNGAIAAVPNLANGVVSNLGFLYLLVDFCFLFAGDQRCIHDHIAGTRVIKVRSAASLP